MAILMNTIDMIRVVFHADHYFAHIACFMHTVQRICLNQHYLHVQSFAVTMKINSYKNAHINVVHRN